MVAYPDEPLRVIVHRMAETGLTRFPVVDRGSTTLSWDDRARRFVESARAEPRFGAETRTNDPLEDVVGLRVQSPLSG